MPALVTSLPAQRAVPLPAVGPGPSAGPAPSTGPAPSGASLPEAVVAAHRQLAGLPESTADLLTRSFASQTRGPFNPGGLAASANCGPTAALMGVRLLGRNLPGAPMDDVQAAIDVARVVATGRNDPTEGTSAAERARIFAAARVPMRASDDIDVLLAHAGDGRAVVLSGWADTPGTWHDRFTPAEVPRDGHHAVTVVRPGDGSAGWYVLDPRSQVGPIRTTEAELRRFHAAAAEHPNADGTPVDTTSAMLGD